MASSMAAKRLALVVTPAWLPSCTWFIAMASKAWHSAGQWLRGWTTVWTKCLTTGNMAMISAIADMAWNMAWKMKIALLGPQPCQLDFIVDGK